MIPNSRGGGPRFDSWWSQLKSTKSPVSHNNPQLTITTFFGQNRLKPVLAVKIDQNPLFRSKTSFSSQNRPNPLFAAKIDSNQFFRSKPSFSGQNRRRPVFWGQNRPKPPFSAKIRQGQFFQSTPSFSGQNQRRPIFSAKIDRNQWHLEKFRAENRKMKTAR